METISSLSSGTGLLSSNAASSAGEEKVTLEAVVDVGEYISLNGDIQKTT